MTATTTQTRKWAIDRAHTTVGFTARHMMITKVRGKFGSFTGDVDVPEGTNVPVSLEAKIDVASIDTREEQRDAHLRSGDFFDAEKFPQITFRSTNVQRRDDEHFSVTGDLTIRDVTKAVTFDTSIEGRGKDPWGGERIGYSATLRINRKDFGLTWNQTLETGGVLVGDTIEIELDVQVVPAA